MCTDMQIICYGTTMHPHPHILCMYTQTHTHIHTHTYTYTRTHACTHTFTHIIHVHASSSLCKQLNYGGSSSLFADLIHYIRTNCNCNFNGNGGAIDTVEVSCRDESEDKVVVRARLVAPTDSSFSRMLSLIEEWKYNTRSVLVGGQRLDIDLSCPTSIDSLYSPECHTQSYAIAGGILGAVFGAAVLMACVLVVIGVVKNRKHFKRQVETAVRHYGELVLIPYQFFRQTKKIGKMEFYPSQFLSNNMKCKS